MGIPNSTEMGNGVELEKHRKVFEDASQGMEKNFGGYVSLESPGTLSDKDLEACFDLIALTSKSAYMASNQGWSTKNKRAEMREASMRYILLRANLSTIEKVSDSSSLMTAGSNLPIAGFLSYMLTLEDEINVVYIYEIHLQPSIQGKGIGGQLIRVVEHIGKALGMEKAMLTVFTSNDSALRFYTRLGYEKWDEEPVVQKRLRSQTKDSKPTYFIYAKDLEN